MENYNRKSPVNDKNYNRMIAPRYTEIATFMRTSLGRDLFGVDIALIGVPFDGGVSNRPGARHGSSQIREMSRLTRIVHHGMRINPYALCQSRMWATCALSVYAPW